MSESWDWSGTVCRDIPFVIWKIKAYILTPIWPLFIETVLFKKVPSPHMKISFWFFNENWLSFHLKILDSSSYEEEKWWQQRICQRSCLEFKSAFSKEPEQKAVPAYPLKTLWLHLNYSNRNGWQRNAPAVSDGPTRLSTCS